MGVVQKEFGKWLHERRYEKRLTQGQVAQRAGVSTSYISTLERGQRHSITNSEPRPALEVVDAIAKALEEDIDEARLAAGYASTANADPEGFYSGINKLPTDRQAFARRQVKAIIDALAEEEDPDTDYIDDEK